MVCSIFCHVFKNEDDYDKEDDKSVITNFSLASSTVTGIFMS